jgi:hypothetical protein
MNTKATTTSTTSEPSRSGMVGPIIRRVHPNALKMLHGALPNGEMFLSKVDAGGMLVDLMVALLPEESTGDHPIIKRESIDEKTISTGELCERLATAIKQRDDLRCELYTIAQLALIASTLSTDQKNLLLSVIHDRADIQSKKPVKT